MKAIRIIRPYELEICEVDEPKIEHSNEVIIKVTSGGICGSDIGIFNGTNSLATYPRIIGHEFGGIVVEKGQDVKEIKIGDYVAVDPVISCGHCYACRIGRHNVCANLEAMGVHRDGGFSEFVKVNKGNVHRFKSKFDTSLLALVEPYSIGMQINYRGQISEGDKVLIIGSGAIGLCTLNVAKNNGAKVLIADIVEEKLKVAEEMGADQTVLVGKESLQKVADEFSNGEGMPVVVDTVCNTSSFEGAIEIASPAGRVVVIGLTSEPSQIVQADITKKELTIIGSRLNCNRFDEVIKAFEAGKLSPELIKTHVFDFRKAEDALNLILNKPEEVIKAVLDFN